MRSGRGLCDGCEQWHAAAQADRAGQVETALAVDHLVAVDRNSAGDRAPTGLDRCQPSLTDHTAHRDDLEGDAQLDFECPGRLAIDEKF